MISPFDYSLLHAYRQDQSHRNYPLHLGVPQAVTLLGDVAGDSLLDLGCGYAYALHLVSCASYTGVDNEPTMLVEAQKTGGNILNVDLETAPALGKFDVAICWLTSHYLGGYAGLVAGLDVQRAVVLAVTAGEDFHTVRPTWWCPNGAAIDIYYRSEESNLAPWISAGFEVVSSSMNPSNFFHLFEVKRP